MVSISRELQIELAGLAGLAPSPHNIQPARWRFTTHGDATAIELHECTTRWLRVGDPSRRDNLIALGAAWEGMSIALAEHGIGLSEYRLLDASDDIIEENSLRPSLRPIAAATVVERKDVDRLAALVRQRRSYRGSFPAPKRAQQTQLAALVAASDFALGITAASDLEKVAAWYDEAAGEGLRNPAFAKELYAWMRFSPNDPDWSRDGLSSDCMSLSWWEAGAARLVMKPAVVRSICTLGLQKLLVSEAAKVKSASMLLLLHAPMEQAAFDTGRQFYRLWLELTGAGFCGVPMSALVDSAAHASRLLESWSLPPGRRLVNVMRVGPMPAQPIPKSARLPAKELLV